MKIRCLILAAVITFSLCVSASEIRYSGGDISLYPTYQKSGSKYKDENGKEISLLPYLHEIGMNAMRVRLFVDPSAYPGEKDPNACQDLPYVLPLCKDIVDNGFELMLDFHYSDTWADPGAQWIPEAWKNLTDTELVKKVYDYTKETLLTLQANGITPKFIQPGNEISYGMLWGPYNGDVPGNHVYTNSSEASWQRFGKFLTSAIKACREVCPDSEIIIHTERVQQVNVLTNFYDRMKSLAIDYDIIGLSYYPYFHGKMQVLDNALSTIEKRYPEKPIMIVETGFPIYWAVPGTNQEVEYDYSMAGQDAFAHDLVDVLLSHKNVNGLFWWWLEYNPYGANLTNWYNAPLFDPYTGKATPALKTIASYASDDTGVDMIDADEVLMKGRWWDINGRIIEKPSIPGLYIHDGKKIMIK